MDDNKITQNLVESLLKDRNSERRYRLIYRAGFLILFLFIISLMYLSSSNQDNYTESHIAVIEINGMIGSGGPVNVENIIPFVKNAFNNKTCNGVILKINSPGGSATQSKIIFDEINKLKSKNAKKVYSVIEDVGASGGYYIAASGDRIFSSTSSIVGSIGVRLDSFNIGPLMNKLGIKSQVISSGKDKTILDPYNSLSEEHKAHLKKLLFNIHDQFIKDIKKSRSSKIDGQNVFTGLFWTGDEATKIGLVDEIASIYDVNEKYFNNINLITYNNKKNVLKELLNTILNYPAITYGTNGITY